MKIPTILEDERPIKAIYYNNSEGEHFIANEISGTRIIAYGEPGHMAMIPYFAVIDREGSVNYRIPASMVEVHYLPTVDENG